MCPELQQVSNSCCLLNQNTAYVVTANHNCHHFLFISMGVNCYTFTCYNYVQLTKGLRQLRKCKKNIETSMGTVVDVIINQGATHRHFTYLARGRNLYKLIGDP